MEPEDVVEIVNALEREGIAVWLDGGWGVDALVGAQTRPHADLDLTVDRGQLERIQDKLAKANIGVSDNVPQGGVVWVFKVKQ